MALVPRGACSGDNAFLPAAINLLESATQLGGEALPANLILGDSGEYKGQMRLEHLAPHLDLIREHGRTITAVLDSGIGERNCRLYTCNHMFEFCHTQELMMDA